MKRKTESQIKVRLFTPSDPDLLIRLLVTFKLYCDINSIVRRPVSWLYQSIVLKPFSITLNICTAPATHTAAVLALIGTVILTTQQNLLHSSPNEVSVLFKKFTIDQKIFMINWVVLYYKANKQSSNVSPALWANCLHIMRRKVDDIYSDATL